MSTLDDIMSGEGQDAPELETAPISQEQQAPTAGAGIPDDDNLPEMVPAGVVKAEREKGKKRYTEAIESFDKRFSDLEAKYERRHAELISALRPQPQVQQQRPAPQPQDFYADPDAYIGYQAQRVVDPVLQSMRQQMAVNARLTAEAINAPEAVAAAEQAFNEASRSGQMDPRIYNEIQSSPNPYHAAVQWHKHVQQRQKYGADPEAYIKAEIERRMAEAKQPAAQQPPAGRLPQSFADARNQSAGNQGYQGARPLSEIMKR